VLPVEWKSSTRNPSAHLSSNQLLGLWPCLESKTSRSPDTQSPEALNTGGSGARQPSRDSSSRTCLSFRRFSTFTICCSWLEVIRSFPFGISRTQALNLCRGAEISSGLRQGIVHPLKDELCLCRAEIQTRKPRTYFQRVVPRRHASVTGCGIFRLLLSGSPLAGCVMLEHSESLRGPSLKALSELQPGHR